MRTARRALFLAMLLPVSLSVTGCTYMGNRGRDALEIFDVGVVVSDHARPDFAAFLNFWNIFPLGYAHVDGKLIGIGGGRAGIQQLRHDDSWGVLAWGAEQRAVGELPPGTDVPPRYDQGFARLALGADRDPPGHQYFDCDRTFHLGWIGLHLRIQLDELADFFTGWAGMDLMADDPPFEPEGT
ncbi:MAG: hypothetical protein R6X33_14160 [Candidatus Brocadiia bacterium]